LSSVNFLFLAADFEERFIEWMKSPVGANFSVMVGIHAADLVAGHYVVTVQNGRLIKMSAYDLDQTLAPFKIKREFQIATTNWIGGKNPHFFTIFFWSGIFLLLLGVCMIFVSRGHKPEVIEVRVTEAKTLA
jgi:hypothetical protein